MFAAHSKCLMKLPSERFCSDFCIFIWFCGSFADILKWVLHERVLLVQRVSAAVFFLSWRNWALFLLTFFSNYLRDSNGFNKSKNKQEEFEGEVNKNVEEEAMERVTEPYKNVEETRREQRPFRTLQTWKKKIYTYGTVLLNKNGEFFNVSFFFFFL